MKTPYFSLIAGFSLLVISCNLISVVSPTLTPTAPSLLTSTATAIPSPTSAPTPAIVSSPTAWTFLDPHDPSLPELFLSDQEGYQLTPAWEPIRIEYVYKWWGLADPVFDHQQVDYKNGQYLNDGQEVPTEKVKSLISAIAHLHPTQYLLAGNSHTDDYPSWTVELTDQAGQSLLLSSSSTDNPGSGPWNVLYNGRLYAQYDGSLGAALQSLFSGAEGQPAAAYYPGDREPGSVAFATGGWPAQLTEGFTGLLPLADGFYYQAQAQAGQFQGYIQGRSSIGGMGHMIIGTITGIEQINLTHPDGQTQACKVDAVESSDPAAAEWTFVCAVEDVTLGTHYRYPLEVIFRTETTEHLHTQGELVGVWETSGGVLRLPLSEEVQTLFAQNDVIQDLLRDHVPVQAWYVAQMNPQPPKSETLVGEVILLGQTQVADRVLRYSIGTPFAIQDGALVHWKLTRPALTEFLNEIRQLPLTKRALDRITTPELNLWYAEPGTLPEVPYLINASAMDYALHGEACAGIPAWTMPTNKHPLKAFGFNSQWNFWQADFVLLDGRPLVSDLDLWPGQEDPGGRSAALLPSSLDTGEHPPFDRIRLEGSSSFGEQQPELTLEIPGNADAASRKVYDDIAKSLPVAVDKSYATLWEAKGLAFVVQDDGSLSAVACADPEKKKSG